MLDIHSDWKHYLENEFNQPYFKKLKKHIEEQYNTKIIYPPKSNVFKSLNETPFESTKVIILGQDPYHGPRQANGLSFSVNQDQSIPPSLKNIYKELINDLNCSQPPHGDLTHWADQGVLLLNTVLTVEEGKAHSHRQLGWEKLTDKVLEILNNNKENLVFILWGKHALNKGKKIDRHKHLVLHAPHPSPLSAYRGFFGCKPFSKANTYLKQHNKKPIKWCW